jgi:PAS domain S-box-containing protein
VIGLLAPTGNGPDTKAQPAVVRWPGWVSRASGLTGLGVGTAVLLGWVAGIGSLLSLAPGWPAMSVLTALCMALLGLGLLVPAWVSVCAGATALVSVLRLAAHAAHVLPGIDSLGLADPRGPGALPASMSPGTALTVLLLSTSLLLLGRRQPAWPFQALTLLALFMAWLGVGRYLFGGEPLVPMAAMALHTALLLGLLGLGTLCRQPHEGLVGLLASDGPGGAIARSLLLPTLLLPTLAGWLRVQGVQAGWFSAEAGLTLLTAALGVALGAMMWHGASALNRTDIDRRQAADRVRANQQRLQAIVESALDAVVTIDSAGVVTAWSARAETTFGWTATQAVGQPIDTLIVPERHREAHRRGMGRYLETGHSTMLNKRVEMQAVHRDGHEFPVDLSIAAIRIDGAPGFSAFLRNISARKHAEAVQERLAAIVEHTEDAILSKSPDGLIVSWNRGAQQLFGYTEHEAVGQPVLMLIPDRLAEEELRMLALVREHKQSTLFEAVRRRKDGSEVEVSVQISPILSVTGEVVGESSITRDITESKRRAAELQRSNAELEQFAYVASHDLQEPLRMVANYTEMLARRYKGQLDEKADKYIHYASDGARRMQRLVSDLLAYSRVGSQGQPLEPTSSQKALQDVLKGLQQVVRETGTRVEFDGLPTVMADPSQLHQLLQNLISNAIKFRGDAPPHIVVRAQREGTQWSFSVADNGIGLEQRYAERIFQMFQRLHELGRYEGSGIGLAICKRIVERHGGRIWVDSTLGKGTTFHFTLANAERGSA